MMLTAIFASMILSIASDGVRQRSIRPDDSLRVLLFASSSPAACSISRHSAPTQELAVSGGRLMLNGRLTDRPSFSTTGQSEWVTISIVGGSRRLRGSVSVVADGNRVRIIAAMSAEDYLAGALAAESYAGDPIEYLIALATLQRNFIATHRHRHAPLADVCDNTHCQRTDMGSASVRQRAAVAGSAGIVLNDAPCYYSVNCGGRTLTPKEVWGRTENGYASVRCDYCSGSRWRRWGRSIPSSPEVDRLLSSRYSLPFVDDDLKIALGRLVGFGRVPGNTFDRIERRGRTWRIYGRGFGHRVGLCQEGALHLARLGRSAREILAFYFPTREVSR